MLLLLHIIVSCLSKKDHFSLNLKILSEVLSIKLGNSTRRRNPDEVGDLFAVPGHGVVAGTGRVRLDDVVTTGRAVIGKVY